MCFLLKELVEKCCITLSVELVAQLSGAILLNRIYTFDKDTSNLYSDIFYTFIAL